MKNQDQDGWSAIHYVVKPFRFGSYENVKILDMLLAHKFKFDLKDKEGKSPIDFAVN